HRGAADTAGADEPGQPRQAVEGMLLRHGDAEHSVIEHFRIDAAAGQLGAGNVRSELDTVQAGEAALPARERRAPVGTVGNFGGDVHRRASGRSVSVPRRLIQDRLKFNLSWLIQSVFHWRATSY